MSFQVTESQKQLPLIDEIKALVQSEFLAVDQLIRNNLYSNVPLIEDISNHIIKSGGKRLRPLIVLLIAKAFAYEGNDHLSLAAVVEFIHTATLLHDDVVDGSSLRRGQKTANEIWGNAASVLVGDFLYSRTFQILTSLKNSDIMDVLAETTNAIAEGEVLQLVKRNDPTTDEDHYLKVICNKTARLFQAAAEVAAMITQTTDQQRVAMARFGLHFGMAFQLVDDALDYVGSTEILGKNIGDDLAEGKATLPLIHAMSSGSSKSREVIEKAIRTGEIRDLPLILQAIQEANALQYTLDKAATQIQTALECLNVLPESVYHDGLKDLSRFILHRSY